MSRDLDVVELWSSSGQGLILTGRARQIDEVIELLKLPADIAVPISRDSTALALWGRSLDAYVQEFHQKDFLIEIVGARDCSEATPSRLEPTSATVF